MESILNADTSVFIYLNTVLTHPILDSVMPFITEQKHWYPVLAGILLAMSVWGGRRGRMASIALLIAVILSDQVVCTLLKPLLGRVRPCNALPTEQCRLLVGRSTALSFPSAHAANSFAMATVVSWRFPKATLLWVVIAALVSYSRVYVGVHYPLDVVAGIAIGVLLGKLAIWVVVEAQRRLEAWRAGRSEARTV